MSTPEQPASPPLTRKQMREIRNTGSNPVITPEEVAAAAADPQADAPSPEPTPAPVAAAPLPRPAQPVAVPPPPVADSAVDLGVSPLTRRQARQQERIRTASVPVITPEVIAAHAAAHGSAAAAPSAPVIEEVPPADEEPSLDTGIRELFGIGERGGDEESEAGAEEPVDDDASATEEESSSREDEAAEDEADEVPAPVLAAPVQRVDGPPPAIDLDTSSDDAVVDAEAAAVSSTERATVSPLFGAALLADEQSVTDLPASFDQILARSTTGSVGAPNALIMSQTPDASALVAPVTATGEVLITGTFNLPEGLGSTGHALGAADGKEIDATLVDGELPAHSSPTPIAASAAISTVKTAGEVIKPPVPEKGSKLMMTLAITAGVLALALVGVLILAFVTGVF
jgi:hypothetical protein